MDLRIIWKPEFETGVRVMDEQHRMLVQIINEIDAADPAALADIVARLKEYAALHFDTEEMLMAQYGYLDASAHANEHERFAAHVEQLVIEQSMVGRIDKENLFAYLSSWLINHIARSDQALARALIAHPAYPG